jgi:hypothetical protein
VPATAYKHFQDDIARARNIVTHAAGLPAGVLRSDLFRSAWMFALGALDAYFCDAYTDIVAAAYFYIASNCPASRRNRATEHRLKAGLQPAARLVAGLVIVLVNPLE